MYGCLKRRQNLKVCNEDPSQLKDSNNKETVEPRFDKELWAHFIQLLSWHAPNVKEFRGLSVQLKSMILTGIGGALFQI